MTRAIWAFICGAAVTAAVFAGTVAHGQSAGAEAGESVELRLAEGAVCEDVRNFAPYHPAVAFSISVGRVSCYSLFDPVPEETFIYHHWFFRDNSSTKKRLRVKPPRWATFSTIQLRQTDKGPWRVEISDQDGRVLKTLRFSVTD